jgi:hypothetical protein
MKTSMRLLMAGLLSVSLNVSAQAQTSSSNPALSGFRKNFATIMFCGLGGAVLGLSTLSFYGKPEEHIGNISTGFAIGILGGVALATADTAQNSRRIESYSLHDTGTGKRIAQVEKSDAIVLPLVLTDF